MPNALTTPANKSAKELPKLTDDAKAAIRWMRQRAGEAANFAGIEDVIGQGLEKLVAMEWGHEARDLFDDNGNNQFPGDDELGELDELEAHEPSFVSMSLAPRAGDERPTMATMLSLCRSKNAKDKSLGEHLKKNPALVQLPTREQVATMLQSNDDKVRRLGLSLHRRDLTEEGRQDRHPTATELAEADRLVDRVFGKK